MINFLVKAKVYWPQFSWYLDQFFREALAPPRIETINFFMSKVKGEGQGHIKGQNNIFGHNFGYICRADFQLVSYCSLWKNE